MFYQVSVVAHGPLVYLDTPKELEATNLKERIAQCIFH